MASTKLSATFCHTLCSTTGPGAAFIARTGKSRGAKRVFACASFGLFTDGCDKFDKAYEAGIIDRVLSTNLVYRRPELAEKPWFVEVEMSKYVSYIIETLNHDTTISELLDPVTKINALMEKHKADLAAQGQIKMEI